MRGGGLLTLACLAGLLLQPSRAQDYAGNYDWDETAAEVPADGGSGNPGPIKEEELALESERGGASAEAGAEGGPMPREGEERKEEDGDKESLYGSPRPSEPPSPPPFPERPEPPPFPERPKRPEFPEEPKRHEFPEGPKRPEFPERPKRPEFPERLRRTGFGRDHREEEGERGYRPYIEDPFEGKESLQGARFKHAPPVTPYEEQYFRRYGTLFPHEEEQLRAAAERRQMEEEERRRAAKERIQELAGPRSFEEKEADLEGGREEKRELDSDFPFIGNFDGFGLFGGSGGIREEAPGPPHERDGYSRPPVPFLRGPYRGGRGGSYFGDQRRQCSKGEKVHEETGHCMDVNECAREELNECKEGEKCRNEAGSYTCVALSPDEPCSRPTCEELGFKLHRGATFVPLYRHLRSWEGLLSLPRLYNFLPALQTWLSYNDAVMGSEDACLLASVSGCHTAVHIRINSGPHAQTLTACLSEQFLEETDWFFIDDAQEPRLPFSLAILSSKNLAKIRAPIDNYY